MVVEKPSGKKGESWKVGLADGRIVPLSLDNAAAQKKLALYDVVFVHLSDGGGKARAVRGRSCGCAPTVQGTVVVLENKTGRILAMAGGFSYPLSQLNRATQSRAPARLRHQAAELPRGAGQRACSPTRSSRTSAITLPPIGSGREKDYWTPKNYDGSAGGIR